MGRTPSIQARASLLRDGRGLSSIEYLLILALVAVAGLASWRGFGETSLEKVRAGGNTVKRLKLRE